ncbi:MAG: type II toxin-antitoxin system HicB family antitoxin [Candidatus Peregrinibacteria bacterium]|nr:type II toxin-antitoxin system HicB family antitoxin [Candidatus Peregrinibacteria bacterium]
MKKTSPKRKAHSAVRLPLIVEKDETGFYVIECPILPGCYTQGKTLDEALRNIQEVIHLVSEEKSSRDILENYAPREISFHTITI